MAQPIPVLRWSSRVIPKLQYIRLYMLYGCTPFFPCFTNHFSKHVPLRRFLSTRRSERRGHHIGLWKWRYFQFEGKSGILRSLAVNGNDKLRQKLEAFSIAFNVGSNLEMISFVWGYCRTGWIGRMRWSNLWTPFSTSRRGRWSSREDGDQPWPLSCILSCTIFVKVDTSGEFPRWGYWKKQRFAEEHQKPRGEISLSGCHAWIPAPMKGASFGRGKSCGGTSWL